MDPSGVIQLIILIILLLLSGFFSSAETALTTVNRVKMRGLEDDGNKRAAIVNKILEKNAKMLSAILIGNNVVNLSASALATTLALRISLPVGIATGILTLAVLIFGEIVPKTWAMIHADRVALAYARLIYGMMMVLTPVIFIIEGVSNIILKLIGTDPAKRLDAITEEELKTYVDVSHEDGVIETEEREMIYNVFDFSDALAKDIMIPRIDMITVDENDSYETVLSIFRECMYTRLPVYREDKDYLVGFINIKDFILVDRSNFDIKKILREAHYTYEFKRVADLLMEMRKKSTGVTFVLNEYGTAVGMITLEDLLEEIVGEIRDEYDADEAKRIQKKGERIFLVEGSMKLDDINDELGTELHSDDFDSISGILIQSLDRLPEDNEEVTLENGIKLKVQGLEQNRILKVLMTLPEQPVRADEEAAPENE